MATHSRRRLGLDDPPQLIEELHPDPTGTVVSKHYSKGRFLGKGSFARCYEMTCLDTQQIYAAKVIPKAALTKTRLKQKVMSEIKIHRTLKHPNIVEFKHVFEDAENVYMLLELCGNESMHELLTRRKRLLEIEVQCYALQVISALKYLHSHMVIHRDVKLGNLLLSDRMEVKLGDFGLAAKVEFDGERKRTICGTPNYIAPEVLEGVGGHSYEADIWSLGVVLYTLLIGQSPFETAELKTTYHRIKISSYTFPDSIHISTKAKDLISRILIGDPYRRPTLDDILEHQFFRQGSSIPKLLPVASLSCPPSATYLRQFADVQRPESAVRSLISTPKISSRCASPILRPDSVVTKRVPKILLKKKTESEDAGRKLKSPSRETPAEALVFVQKWVDYSSKYGLGYLLSNGSFGVNFIDSSVIACSPDAQEICYIDKKGSDGSMQTYSLSTVPEELKRKVTLLHRFRSYLDPEPKSQPSSSKCVQTIYLKKWMRLPNAVLFRLSNKTVHVSFEDQTSVILPSGSKTVTYVDEQGKSVTQSLSAVLSGVHGDVWKKLKNMNEMLSTLLSGKKDRD